MQQSGYPAKVPLPWANAASSSYRNAIPTPSQSATNPDLASFTDGFPPGTFGAGGNPPYGQDFNGILNFITAGLQYLQAGSLPVYDSGFASAIAGYPKGALLASTSLGSFWVNQVDGNTGNPDAGAGNWVSLFAGLAPIASPNLTGTPTVPTPAGGSNTAQIANTSWVSGYFAARNGSSSQPFAASNLTASTGVFGQSQTFTSSGNFTVPSGVSRIKVYCTGGGAGGANSAGGSPGSNFYSGGGGGSGGTAIGTYSVSPGQSFSVTVGGGGTNQAGGGTSSFGSLCSGIGGSPVSPNTTTNGGSLGGGASGGTIADITGGNGTDGQQGTAFFPGNGGASFWGGGGRGSVGGGTAANGVAFGSGGGGAYAAAANGGNGAGGIVVVEW